MNRLNEAIEQYNIRESHRRFMDSVEIQQPPTRRDWLETIALVAVGFVAGAIFF